MERKDLLTPKAFSDYELLDSGDGRKLERFGIRVVSRPDSQSVWKISDPALWGGVYASFEVGKDGAKGSWKFAGGGDSKAVAGAKAWHINFQELKFEVKPTPFRHLGVFPEQSSHWEFMAEKIKEKIKKGESPKVLNLFGYTGAASLACAKAGAKITHVDASAPSIEWAKENQRLSGLAADSVRWICDDALKFARREVKRGNKYEGIIIDPPKFGRGPDGEVWKLEENILELIEVCGKLLSENYLFVILTVYATDISSVSLANLFASVFKNGDAKIEYGELRTRESSERGFELAHAIYAKLL